MTSGAVDYQRSVNLGQVLQIFTMASAIIGYGIYVHIGLRESELARAKYIPIVENLMKDDDLQNERIENITDTLREIRKVQGDQAAILTELARDVAVIKSETLRDHEQQRQERTWR